MATISYYQVSAVTIDLGGQMMPNGAPIVPYVGQTIDGHAQDLGPMPAGMRMPPLFATSAGLPMPSMPMPMPAFPAAGMATPMMLAPPRPQRGAGNHWAMASTIIGLLTLAAVLFG